MSALGSLDCTLASIYPGANGLGADDLLLDFLHLAGQGNSRCETPLLLGQLVGC